jgi:hypothetical protein
MDSVTPFVIIYLSEHHHHIRPSHNPSSDRRPGYVRPPPRKREGGVKANINRTPDSGEEDFMGTLRKQLEEQMLARVCSPLEGYGFPLNIINVITEEITVMLHLKINDIFEEDDMEKTSQDVMNRKIITYLSSESVPLTRILVQLRESMLQFVTTNLSEKISIP